MRDARHFSALARRLPAIDLLDPDALAPFARQGLRSSVPGLLLISFVALNAVDHNDAELAQKIIKSDYEIDEMEVEIEEECLKVLALHQPVAVDLRFLIAVIKINNDLERIGDQAVNIAERVDVIAKRDLTDFFFDYSSMGKGRKNVEDEFGCPG